jgi:hypothetical protein
LCDWSCWWGFVHGAWGEEVWEFGPPTEGFGLGLQGLAVEAECVLEDGRIPVLSGFP